MSLGHTILTLLSLHIEQLLVLSDDLDILKP